MSDNKDNLDIQSGTSASGSQHTKDPITVAKESVVEVAKNIQQKIFVVVNCHHCYDLSNFGIPIFAKVLGTCQ